jgi:hypothetical protein
VVGEVGLTQTSAVNLGIGLVELAVLPYCELVLTKLSTPPLVLLYVGALYKVISKLLAVPPVLKSLSVLPDPEYEFEFPGSYDAMRSVPTVIPYLAPK